MQSVSEMCRGAMHGLRNTCIFTPSLLQSYRIERVLDWGEARGFRPAGAPNPARWRGFLETLLAAPRKVQPVQHHAALPYAEVPGLMAALAADATVAAMAARFIIMTTCRMREALTTPADVPSHGLRTGSIREASGAALVCFAFCQTCRALAIQK
jgi:hypothetical protein